MLHLLNIAKEISKNIQETYINLIKMMYLKKILKNM